MVAETDRNDPATVRPRSRGGLGMTAQWDDDVHHALHWLLTGETQGYYADFGSAGAVATALERAFLHDGRWSSFRGRTHGRPVDWVDARPWRFVVSLQTHDQVGNRAQGERLAALAGPDLAACGAALLLTLPFTPMLFMGEEWGASTPWQFFTSFADPTVSAAVTTGRLEEFAGHDWAGRGARPAGPGNIRTFPCCRLPPPWDGHDDQARLLRWYRDLILFRREHLTGSAPAPPASQARPPPACAAPGPANCADERPDWFAVARGRWRTVVNVSGRPHVVQLHADDSPDRAVVRLAWRDGAQVVQDEPASVRLLPRCAAVVEVVDRRRGRAAWRGERR